MASNNTEIEKRLWNAADTLRANSNYASNEYFLPVMGLIFLRHAYSRYLMVKEKIEAGLPKRGGKTRELTKEDFSQKGAIFLRPHAQFEYLVSLKDSDDRAKAIMDAMEAIEADYDSLKGVLPKSEYQELDNDVLGQLLRTLNPEELKHASGDVFGRIYEYFLTGFADLKAHDNGEFFTPISLVSLLANVLEPQEGIVLDPACGSGGMFVQSAHFVERQHLNPTERLTFYGLEKNATTIRLAKMNLAVHGLEGDIQKAITYYEDPHELFHKASYVMANPPFNVDEVDADKVKNDPRLPFGLPGVNKNGKVVNGNYLWISYFYSYLNDHGRAGFVMSSQASNAGRDEAKVRRKLIETGDVEIMIAIRSNFFYTRTVPCELWFLNRNKPEEHKDKVLMIDARNIFRKVTRKIYDFSPEQLQNILAIVWLYRGESQRFINLVASYMTRIILEANICLEESGNNSTRKPIDDYVEVLTDVKNAIYPFIETISDDLETRKIWDNFTDNLASFAQQVEVFSREVDNQNGKDETNELIESISDLHLGVKELAHLSESSREIVRQSDQLYKEIQSIIEHCISANSGNGSGLWNSREISKLRKDIEDTRQTLVDQLKQVRYYYRQATWLLERFPDGQFCNVEGLVKLVDRDDLEKAQWSLTPGRYVGVAPEEEDENFDFEEAIKNIHLELEALNDEAIELAGIITKNLKELGI